MFAIIERNMNGTFSSGEQQAFTRRIFAYDVNVFVIGNSVHNFYPTIPAVACAIDMRPQIIKPQRIHGSVSYLLIKVAGLQNRDFLEWLQPGCDIFPMRSAISCHMN